MDAEVGGDDCTKISSNIKKLENKLIPKRGRKEIIRTEKLKDTIILS